MDGAWKAMSPKAEMPMDTSEPLRSGERSHAVRFSIREDALTTAARVSNAVQDIQDGTGKRRDLE